MVTNGHYHPEIIRAKNDNILEIPPYYLSYNSDNESFDCKYLVVTLEFYLDKEEQFKIIKP